MDARHHMFTRASPFCCPPSQRSSNGKADMPIYQIALLVNNTSLVLVDLSDITGE
jgi:hypothetical protein